MRYKCPNGHGKSDIYPICMNCEANMIDTTKEGPKGHIPSVVEEVVEAPVEEAPKKKKK